MAPNGPASPHTPALDTFLSRTERATAHRDFRPTRCCKRVALNERAILQEVKGCSSKSRTVAVVFPMTPSQMWGVGGWGFAGPWGAREGPHEPPGMDSRRVPRTHTAPPSHGQAESAWLRLRLRPYALRPK